MMLAWAVFTVGNTVARIVSSQFFVGEPLSWATLAGISTIFAGACLVKAGS
jgi:multidrug transporter EmrE-like cation transporter